MKFSALSFYAIALFFCGLFFNQNAFACSCFPLPPIYEAYEQADAVFIGKVTASNEPKEEREYYESNDIFFDIEVIENFKGAKNKQIKLNKGSMSSSCYSGFAVGETYLFYAWDSAGDGFFKDNIKGENIVYQGSFCNRTNNLRAAQDQIYFIREMLKGKPEPQIYGSVARSDQDPKTLGWRYTYLDKIKVVLKGENGGRYETTTDEKGIFRFNNIPEGSYTLEPEPPTEYKTYFPASETFRVLPDKTITSDYPAYKSFYTDFGLRWNNSVNGKVVDTGGKPLKRYAIDFLPPLSANKEISTDKPGFPDYYGERDFWQTGITPGKYVLAMDIYAPFENGVKKRVLYSDDESKGEAKVFDVTPTFKIPDLSVKVPFTIRMVKAEIFWSDGQKSFEWAQVEAKKTADAQDKNNISYDWDSGRDGSFEIQVFEGFEYWVFAEMWVSVYENREEKRVLLKAEPQKIKVGTADIPLRFTFDKPENIVKLK